MVLRLEIIVRAAVLTKNFQLAALHSKVAVPYLGNRVGDVLLTAQHDAGELDRGLRDLSV